MHSRPIVLVALLVAAAAQWGVPSSAAPAKPPAPSRQAIAVGAKLCDRADALLKAGKAKEALALYEQALKLLPASPRARAGVNAARKRLAGAAAAPPKPAEPAEPAPGAQAGAAQPAEAQRPVKELSLDSAETARSLLLAVLPFGHLSAHAENAWVGEAAAETLAAKLGDISGVQLVERRRLQEVVQAGLPAPDAEAAKAAETGKLLGAEALVLGSVQSTGAWDRPGTTVRLDARVVRVETGQVADDTTVSVDGAFQDLLRLQRELAEKLLRALGVAPSEEEARLLAKEEAQSLEALRAFGEGRRLLGQKDYRGALALLQEAQRKNGGEFFAAAHRAEGEAYNGQVEIAPEAEKAGLQKEYLEKFRRDAEEAAPAFYDLGVAYEANKLYAEAIQAYESFLKHAGRSARSIRWRRRADSRRILGQGEPPRGEAYPHWAVSGKMLLLWDGEAQIEGVDLESGASLWRQTLPKALAQRRSTPGLLHGIPIQGHSRFMLCSRGDHGFKGVNGDALLLINGLTGRPIWPRWVDVQYFSLPPFVVAGETCLWVDRQGILTTCDVVSGTVRWQGAVALGPRGARPEDEDWRLYSGGDGAYVTRAFRYGRKEVPAVLVGGISPLNGQPRWSYQLAANHAVVPFGGRVAFCTRVREGIVDISVCDGASGRTLWRRRVDAMAAAGSEALLVLCGGNGLVALDAASGQEVLRLPVAGLPDRLVAKEWRGFFTVGAYAGLLCRGRLVYLRDLTGELYVIDALGGRVVRRLGGVERALPTWDGGFVARLKETTLVAYSPPGQSARVQDREALIGIGRALFTMGKPAEAAQALAQAVAAAPDAPGAWQWMAVARSAAGDEEGAVGAWQRSIVLLPPGSSGAAYSQAQLRSLSGIAWMVSGLGQVPSLCHSQGVLCVSYGHQGHPEGRAEALGFRAADGGALWRVRIPRQYGNAGVTFRLEHITSHAGGFCAIGEEGVNGRLLALPIHPLIGSVGELVDARQLREVQPARADPVGAGGFSVTGDFNHQRMVGTAGKLARWDAAGKQLWLSAAELALAKRVVSPASFAVTASGEVCAIAGTGHAFGIDPATGKSSWVLPLPEGCQALGVWAFGGDLVYVLDDQGTLYAVDARYAREHAMAGHKWWSEK